MPKYDTYIELVPVEKQEGAATAVMRYGFDRTIGIDGFQKVVNQWLKAFLTEEGTQPGDREYGTMFPRLIGSNIGDLSDVREIVELSVDSANSDIRRYQASQNIDDPTEIFDTARITSFVSDPQSASGIEIYIRLKNQAGEAIQVQLPVRLP